MTRQTPTHVLLLDQADGSTVAVRFPSADAARDWEDAHEGELSAVGCVRVATRTEALAGA